MEDVVGFIYVVTNKINNKKYVGLTTKTIQERWNQHLKAAYDLKSRDSNALFKKAIRKYGPENWEITQLDTAFTIEELKEKEIFWIKELKTFAFQEDNNGYNSTLGGDGAFGHGKVVCKCDILTGKIINKFPTLEEAQKELGSRIECVGEKNHSNGGFCYLYFEDIKFLDEEQLADKIHSLYDHLVYQLNEQGEIIKLFKNTTEAAESVGLKSSGNLISACLGQRRLCKGYQWVYQKDISQHINKPLRDKKKTSVKVTQYSMGGIKIREWNSINDVSSKKRILDSHISQCCKMKRQSAGGFQWRYSSENLDSVPPLFTKRKVLCLEDNKIYETANHAAKFYGFAQQTVKKSCNLNGKLNTISYHFVWCDDLDE